MVSSLVASWGRGAVAEQYCGVWGGGQLGPSCAVLEGGVGVVGASCVDAMSPFCRTSRIWGLQTPEMSQLGSEHDDIITKTSQDPVENLTNHKANSAFKRLPLNAVAAVARGDKNYTCHPATLTPYPPTATHPTTPPPR